MTIPPPHSVRLMRAPGADDRLMLCYRPGVFTESEARQYLDEIIERLRLIAAGEAVRPARDMSGRPRSAGSGG